MAEEGQDVSMYKNFAAITVGGQAAQQESTYSTNPDKAARNSAWMFRWDDKVEVEGEVKIIIPWTFSAEFSHKEYTRGIIADMNADLQCVHLLEIPENEMSTDYNTYSHGIVITEYNAGSNICYAFIGKCHGCCDGCDGGVTSYGVPSSWQVLNLTVEGKSV